MFKFLSRDLIVRRRDKQRFENNKLRKKRKLFEGKKGEGPLLIFFNFLSPLSLRFFFLFTCALWPRRYSWYIVV
jgi:hypothetical protein